MNANHLMEFRRRVWFTCVSIEAWWSELLQNDCHKCRFAGNLRSHHRINHSQDNTMTCEICAYQTPSRRAYRSHAQSHQTTNQNVLVCSSCTYSCKSASELRAHRKTHNRTSRLLSSVVCHNKSTDDVATRQGRNDVGVSRKQFACHQCNASFVRLDSLRSHIRCHQRFENSRSVAMVTSRHDGSESNDDAVNAVSGVNSSMFALVNNDHCITHFSNTADDNLPIESYETING